MIKITVENAELIERTKKEGGLYYVQEIWFYRVNRHGVLEPYPTKAYIFPQRDAQGHPQPYAKGHYTLGDDALTAKFGYLALNSFAKLVPMKI